MKLKKTLSTIVFFHLLLTQIPLTLAGSFSDVVSVNRYYAAIEYLAQNGFVHGYPDGTFQPDRPVNRAEFLKLAMDISGTTLDTDTATGFTDVKESAWYAPYVRKAVAEGWIQGYGDATFKPEQGVTKAEGIKMLAEVQSWQTTPPTATPFNDTAISAWYTRYIAYAKDHKFLDDTGSNFIPDATLLRGKVSGILYRTYLAGYGKSSSSVTGGTVTPAPTTTNFTPVTFNAAPTDFFDNIKLNEQLPNVFYLNEVYYLKGKTPGNYSDIFAFLAPIKESDPKNFINYPGQTNGNSFTIPIIFRKPGNYRLGIITGTTGESKVIDISVLASLPAAPSTKNTTAPTTSRISFKDGKTSITWNNNANNIIRLVIWQSTKTKTFLFRQNVTDFDLDYTDFGDFSKAKTSYMLESALVGSMTTLTLKTGFADSTTNSFDAINHDSCQIDPAELNIDNLPEIYSTVQPLRFNGSAKTDLMQNAAVIRPDGKVDTVNMHTTDETGTYYGSNTIKSGGNFSFDYSPSAKGTYIVEINTQDGEAALNCPVYYTTGIPLIPDFFDLNQHVDRGTKGDIATLRTQLLGLINGERQKIGAGKVVLDSSLNTLAQAQSDDMVTRNFFAHVNPDGKSPDDRRLAMNIPTPVGENLADAPTLLYAHYGLMRSAIHRTNVIDQDWTRVGIGIAWDKDMQVFVTEEFSTSPLNETDILNLENEVIAQINKKRSLNKIRLIEKDIQLSTVATNWSTKMTGQNFFDFSSPSGETLISLVQNAVPSKNAGAILVQAPSKDKLIEKIIAGNDATNAGWNKLGIGIKLDNEGNMIGTLIYTTY
jgi:uncharacterized protein YkwD